MKRLMKGGLAVSILFALSAGVSTSALAAQPTTPLEQLAQCAQHAHTQNVPASTWMDGNPNYDEIVIDFDDAMPNATAEAIGRKWGLNLHLNSAYSDDANLFIARVPEGAVPAYKECMRNIKGIEAIDENFRLRAFEVPEEKATSETKSETNDGPNDPLYQFQWNLKQIGVEKAWKESTGKGAVVAVIDTGVALDDDASRNIRSVKDLADTGRVEGYDFVDDDDFAWDGHGHGTHVAGTIAQSTNNKYGVAGIAYDADIMPLRVLNNEGYGSVSDIADAIRFAADNGANIINMSLGGPLPSLVMSRAIKYAHKKGVTIIAAAGNSGRREASYPAAYKNVIAVAATQFDRATTFYSQYGDFVDIAAPGGNTRVDQNNDGRPDGIMQETLKAGRPDQHEFALYMGTSMASPHVAGVAALIVAQGVTNPDRVEEILVNSVSKSERSRYNSDREYKEHYGAGIVQADAAVASATETPGALRLLLGLLLTAFVFVGARRREHFVTKPAPNALFFIALVASSAGLFFVPNLLGSFLPHSTLLSLLSSPISQWDSVLFGAHYHQNPLLASVLLPLLALLFLGTNGRGKQIVAGLAVGTAAFCFVGAYFLNADVLWIPGTGLLDRAWLLINGLLSLGLASLSLRRF